MSPISLHHRLALISFATLALAVGCSGDGEMGSTSSSSTGSGAAGGGQSSSAVTGSTSTGTSAGGGGQGGSSTGSGPTPCGSTFCAVDETCAGTVCHYPCTGVSVPGDYANVSAAVEALEPVGGTICVGSGTWSDPVGAAPKADMQIIGSASDAIIAAPMSLSPVQGAHLRMAHLEIRGEVFVGTYSAAGLEGDVTIDACTIASTKAGDYAVTAIASFQGKKLLIDRCDLSSVGGLGAVELGVTLTGSSYDVTIQNSYVHGSIEGIRLVNISNAPNLITLVNDTFAANGTALHLLAPLGSALTLRYENDVFTGSTTAIDLTSQPATVVQHANNALFGNTTNYATSAVPGPGYVTSDPLLDAETPPAPGVGSPLVGAAKAASAPVTDFWGTARNGSPDIGAVEGP